MLVLFFFNDTATTEIYTLSLHDALPIFDLLEFVEIVPYLDCDFQKIEERPLLGRIVEIEPENEAGRGQKLILRINDCESEKQDLFQITEIRKERIE